MNLSEAFAIYGAEIARRASRLSAIASDGALIVGCSAKRFSRPAAGVMRYENVLSGDGGGTAEALQQLRQHLELAHKESRPVRLVIITEAASGATPSRTVHVRRDLVGSVLEFDGDRYVIDFVKAGDSG
jgi:hypothetical protein